MPAGKTSPLERGLSVANHTTSSSRLGGASEQDVTELNSAELPHEPEATIADSDDPNPPELRRFSASGLLGSLRSNASSRRIGSHTTARRSLRSRRSHRTAPSFSSSDSDEDRRRRSNSDADEDDGEDGSDDDDRRGRGGLGALVRSLNDGSDHAYSDDNEDVAAILRARIEANRDARGLSRNTSKGSSKASSLRRNGGTAGGGSDRMIYPRLPGSVISAKSQMNAEGLPTVAEKRSMEEPGTRPPPAPSASYARSAATADPKERNMFQRWWWPSASSSTIANTTPGSSASTKGPTPALERPYSPSRRSSASTADRTATPIDPRGFYVHDRPGPLHEPYSHASQLPMNNQDLNQPYIPGRAQHTTVPFQRAANAVNEVFSNIFDSQSDAAASESTRRPLHAISALIATTGNISGALSPAHGAIGPVWSYDNIAAVRGGTSDRRLMHYSRQEAVADEAMVKQVNREYRAVDRHHRRANRDQRKKQQRDHLQRQSGEDSEDNKRTTSSRHRPRSPTVEKRDPQRQRSNESVPARIPGDEHMTDQQLDEIAKEGTRDLLSTEGAANPAFGENFDAQYDDNEVRTTVPSTADSEGSINLFEREFDVENEAGKPRPRRGAYAGWKGPKRGERVQKEIYIKSNRGSESQTRDFIVRLANAMMVYGAPTHRLESQLESTARVLECDAHFFYLPSHLILSFNSQNGRSETAFLRATGGLDTEKLAQVHNVSREVLHDVVSAAEGSQQLKTITAEPPLHPVWIRIIIIGMCSFFASPIAFAGSFIDMVLSFVLGVVMGTCQLTLAARSPLFLNCFEIFAAFLISFFAKGLSATNHFCYQSLASAGIVMILPGYIILQGCLEIASRSIVSGAIRLVYGGILSLFLGVGISLGSTLYVGMDPSSKGKVSSVSLTGTFNSSDPTQSNPLNNGTFTFVDSSSSAVSGTVSCSRPGDTQWYDSNISDWWLFLLVPGFALSLSLWTKAKIRSKQFFVSLVIACSSFAIYYFAKAHLTNQPELSAAICAFAIGLGGTLWSRLARGTAYTSQSTAILMLVPNGLAAAGGIAMSTAQGSTSFEMGTQIALRQIEIAIGITIGLFTASLVTYGFSSRKRSAFFTY